MATAKQEPKRLTFPKSWKNKTSESTGKMLGIVGVHHAKDHAENEEREASPRIAKE
jgi:hypothetical protein